MIRRNLLPSLVLCALPAVLEAQPVPQPQAPDLAKVKEEEAREKLERLEETMDRLSRLLSQTEPQNAAKLKLAFRESRDRLLREGMDRIVKYLKERKLDRAIEEQGQVKVNLEEILSILLEKDIDPRELLKHIRRLRDLVQALDKVIEDETGEKMASDDADQSGASSEALSKDLDTLEDLIRREKEIEKAARAAREANDPDDPVVKALAKLESEQEKVRGETAKLREGDEKREAEQRAGAEKKAAPAQPGDPGQPGQPPRPAEPGAPPRPVEPGQPGQPEQPGQPGQPGQPAQPEPPPPTPESVLDKKALARAEKAMASAEDAMAKADAPRASARTSEARAALEESVLAGKEKLERLRAQRNFKSLEEAQDTTKKETDLLAGKMQETPPLVATPEGNVPGQSEVQAASGDMQEASQSLGQGKAGKASRSQAESLDKLGAGREKAEEALEELQRALRDRLLAYLREKFTKMLNDQRVTTRETRSLDLRLRALKAVSGANASSPLEPEIERKDRQLAENLAGRESAIAVLADDVIDLLAEDGTTLVFPGVVEEIKADLANVSGLLSRIQTGERTQHIQGEIEAALEDILHALEVAQKSPPPPNPGQGRGSKSGAGPLLPLSSELKMVRALQARVNERTRAFDAVRKPAGELAPEEKIQLNAIAKKQKDVEGMLRKLREAAGEDRGEP